MKKFITCITLIAGTSLAHAANDVYGELAYSTFNYSETYSGTVYTASSGSAVRGIIGTEIDENLALEGMFATCLRRFNADHLCRLKLDQGLLLD